jgi:hypothetical protein
LSTTRNTQHDTRQLYTEILLPRRGLLAGVVVVAFSPGATLVLNGGLALPLVLEEGARVPKRLAECERLAGIDAIPKERA